LTIDSDSLDDETSGRGSALLRFAAPQAFFPLAGRMLAWFGALAASRISRREQKHG